MSAIFIDAAISCKKGEIVLYMHLPYFAWAFQFIQVYTILKYNGIVFIESFAFFPYLVDVLLFAVKSQFHSPSK